MTNSKELQKRIKIFIKESDFLISQGLISDKSFKNYKNQIHLILSEVIKSDLNKNIKANAIKALKPYTMKWKSKFFLFNWIYSLLIFKIAYNFNMPFLTGESKSDNYKTQIQHIKMQLETIDFKLKN
ncbi:hypothetical protein [Gillisia sp. CAL575]|uniref:hypothetical protein n=1 Tax=Gillisia sp. CAL575 TaxID=985255 RepID=UPI00055206A0|nr:hypothetical protein [Gillisia sp. CAL575]